MSDIKEYKIVDNSNIKINGRMVKDSDSVHFFWTGSSVELNLKATELHILAEGLYSSQVHYLAIEVNGMVCQRIMLDGTRQWITVFKFFDDSKITNVRIIKETQAMNEDSEHILNFYSIKTDGELLPVNDKKYKLEFIGDSLTSGEGAIGTGNDEPWISHYFSHVRSYPYMVSKLIDADYRIFSKSGWGIHCSWDNNPYFNIPSHYENICSVMPDDRFKELGIFQKNDFSLWQPDAVICNLGTNDHGAFYNSPFIDKDGTVYKLDKNSFEIIKNDVVLFLNMLRKNNPDSFIYWAYGMCDKELGLHISDAVETYNMKYNDNVVYIDMPLTKEEELGARYHPGILSHKECAYCIADILKNDLKINKLNKLIL